MALEIVWTKRAQTGYAKIIEFLRAISQKKKPESLSVSPMNFLSC